MNKAEHGKRLAAAMARKGYGRPEVALGAHVKVRTVTNWTSGTTMPSPTEREALRAMFGNYDSEADPVVVAVEESRLTEDRQYTVLGTYKRELRLQDAEEAEGRTG